MICMICTRFAAWDLYDVDKSFAQLFISAEKDVYYLYDLNDLDHDLSEV